MGNNVHTSLSSIFIGFNCFQCAVVIAVPNVSLSRSLSSASLFSELAGSPFFSPYWPSLFFVKMLRLIKFKAQIL